MILLPLLNFHYILNTQMGDSLKGNPDKLSENSTNTNACCCLIN